MRRTLWAVLSIALVLASCSSEPSGPSEPRDAAGASVSPSPSPSPSPTPTAPPEEQIVRVYGRFRREYDHASLYVAYRMLDRDTVRLLGRLQNATGRAGPEQIARLSLWEKLVVTTLRTDYSEDLLEGLSTQRFLGYVASYELFPIPKPDVTRQRVEVRGATAIASLGRGQRVRFDVEDGEWKVDMVPMIDNFSYLLRSNAGYDGVTVDQYVIETAEGATVNAVPADVWRKP